MNRITTVIIILGCFLFSSLSSYAQMERQRANISQQVQQFWTPALVAQETTHQLEASALNVTIMHSFGIATTDVVRNFFGLDNVQNVRLGLDFGLSDRWSVGIGRSSQLNVVDLRTKYQLLQQTDSKPLSLAIKGDLGIITQENIRPLEDDLSTLASVLISRNFNDRITLQLAPMYAHFNTVASGQPNNLFALGLGSEIQLSDRYSLIAEYYPVLGDRMTGTKNAFSLGLNIQTGGHVFQMFFTSTEWHLEQYVLATNDNQFWAGDFRFGFNVNRIFGL